MGATLKVQLRFLKSDWVTSLQKSDYRNLHLSKTSKGLILRLKGKELLPGIK